MSNSTTKADLLRELRAMFSFLILQGNRVIDGFNYANCNDIRNGKCIVVLDDPTLSGNSDGSAISAEDYYKRLSYIDFVRQDSEVFCLLFYRMLNCLKVWRSDLPEAAQISSALESKFSTGNMPDLLVDAKNMRDINAHIDEYLTGRGYRPDKYTVEYKGRIINAFSIDVDDGILLIGGRINLHDILGILIEIKPDFDVVIEKALMQCALRIREDVLNG